MKKKEIKLSKDAIRNLDNIKIENKNSISIESITIKLDLIFQIEKVEQVKKCTYSSTLIDSNYKSDKFILIFEKEEEIPKTGDVININQIEKYYNNQEKNFVYECKKINFIAKEMNFLVDIKKIKNYYKNESNKDNKIIEENNKIIEENDKLLEENNKINEDNKMEEDEDEEEEEEDDEIINEDNNNNRDKFTSIKNQIKSYEEEKISEKKIINNNQIDIDNKNNNNKNENIFINKNNFENKQNFFLISELNFNIQSFNIYLKCIKKFEKKKFRFKKDNQYQNYVFTDLKNDLIEAVSFYEISEKLDKIININEIYQINNSYLISNNKAYRKTNCPYKIFFTRNTDIFNVSNIEEIKKKFSENKEVLNFPLNENEKEDFNKNKFCKISTIINTNNYDIINIFGFVLKDYGNISFFDQFNREFFGRKILIGDDSNYKIFIFFWHPQDLKQLYKEGELLYIENVKVNEFKELKALYSTKFRKIRNGFNFECDNKLNKYYLEHQNIQDYFLPKVNYKINSQTNFINNNSSSDSKLLFIREILSLNENKDIVGNKFKGFKISATVRKIRHSEKNYYYGCKNCKKKMKGQICNKCGCYYKKLILHFSVRVADSSGCLWLLFFGDIAECFLGIKGEEYKKILDKGISYNNEEIQLLNNKLENKEFIFMGKSQYYSYSNCQGYRFVVKFFTRKKEKEYYSLVKYLKNIIK